VQTAELKMKEQRRAALDFAVRTELVQVLGTLCMFCIADHACCRKRRAGDSEI
jgi:hypothetical protein